MPPHPPPPIIHLALQRCSSLSSLRTAATKEAARGRRCLAASESSDRVARALSSFPASAADDTTGSSPSLHLAAHVLPSRHPSLFERSLLPCRRGDIQPDGASGISTSAISAQQRRWAHSRSAVRMPLRKAAKSTPPASRRRRPPAARPPSRRQRSLALRRSSTNLVHFRSLGCPRNWVDTEHMLGLVLEQSGFSATDDPTAADYTVINTCGFLKAARDESRGEIEDVLANKKEGSKLIVTGCMINIRREEIMREYPEIDAVLGSGEVDKILEAIDECDRKDGDDDGGEEGGEPSETEGAACLEKEEEGDSSSERGPRGRPLPEPRSYLANGDVPRRVATPSHYAYLKIAEGCMKRCSFCVIPKIKGPLKSKPVEQVVDEFKVLLDGGAREIVLIAQDLGDYGKDLRLPRGSGGGGDADKTFGARRGGELARLLRAMLDSTDDPNVWIRLMYLYPDEITDELITVLKSDDRVCRYLDMPIQHINDDVLKAMKRRTTGHDIRRTVARLRAELPGVHVRTSLMVGFPGETEEQFEELLQFVREAQLENVGVFEYSDEDGARSANLLEKVPEDVKSERYARLMEVQLEAVRRRNAKRASDREVVEVVLEGGRMVEDGQADGIGAAARQVLVGRYYGQCPDVDGQVIIDDWEDMSGPLAVGERHLVEVTDFDNYDLIGRIVSPAEQEHAQWID